MPDRANFVSKDWKVMRKLMNNNETYVIKYCFSSSRVLQTYCRVNDKFADCTLDALRNVIKTLDEAGDHDTIPLVWVHDYQLLTTATKIRKVCEEENLRCKLGFFLHIPFPSWDIMRLLPWDDQILQGMLGECEIYLIIYLF